MLILCRKPGEKIDIGGNIVIEVISIDGYQVKIGINAPKNIKVWRREITLQIAADAAENPTSWRNAIRSAVRKFCNITS